MPATLEEAYNDPYSITKRKYEASFLSQDSNPSRTSSFIRNVAQSNFGLTSSHSVPASSRNSMAGTGTGTGTTTNTNTNANANANTNANANAKTPDFNAQYVGIPETFISNNSPIAIPKKKRSSKTKKSKRRTQKGGRRSRNKKQLLFLINVVFGLIIIFSFALCKKYF